MLTKHELRVLYLLRKHGGRAQHSVLSQAMSRTKSADRQRALADCEGLALISSAKVPTKSSDGGRPGLVYWLTSEGIDYVQGLIDGGDMIDPHKEPRAGKGTADAPH